MPRLKYIPMERSAFFALRHRVLLKKGGKTQIGNPRSGKEAKKMVRKMKMRTAKEPQGEPARKCGTSPCVPHSLSL